MTLSYPLSGLLLLALLSGCSSPQQAPATAPTNGDCNVEKLQGELGTRISVKHVEQLQQRANAKTLRVLAPSDAATMDYNPQRLNIDIDESEAIIRLSCG